MLITPLTALAPHSVAPGPRITSMRSISSSSTSWTFQYTPENNGVYTLRPSISTSSLLSNRPLNPRDAIAHLFESMRATSNPGASLNASGMLLAPERRISSCVITKIAAAASATFCVRLDTDVTCMFIRSSMLSFVKSGIVCWLCAPELAAKSTAATPASIVRPADLAAPRVCLLIKRIVSVPSLKNSSAELAYHSPLWIWPRLPTASLPLLLLQLFPLRLAPINSVSSTARFFQPPQFPALSNLLSGYREYRRVGQCVRP